MTFLSSIQFSIINTFPRHISRQKTWIEYLLVLPNTSEENAFLFGERFRREVEKMEFIPAGEEEAHKITISGGISTYPCMPDVEEDANTVIRYAEHALYNAKHRGRNKMVQFSQMNLEM